MTMPENGILFLRDVGVSSSHVTEGCEIRHPPVTEGDRRVRTQGVKSLGQHWNPDGTFPSSLTVRIPSAFEPWFLHLCSFNLILHSQILATEVPDHAFVIYRHIHLTPADELFMFWSSLEAFKFHRPRGELDIVQSAVLEEKLQNRCCSQYPFPQQLGKKLSSLMSKAQLETTRSLIQGRRK